ncbi:MAG: glycosyltransferase [Oscillospiraceae bacterium]|nr:glycosyltransferase [Oscillospiraceae bacterium]
MNVCLINDSFPPAIDGVANAVTNYAKNIVREGGKPTVVTPFYPNADDSVYPFSVIRYPSVDVTKLVGYRAGLPFAPEIAARMEQEHFDLIHSHCPITSTMLARAVRDKMDVPVVMTYHTKFDIDIANAIRIKALQDEAARLLVENISACDEVWTVSNGAGENLRKLGYQGDYLVMPNGVDFPRGRVSDQAVRETVAGYDLPEGLPVFLFVGRMMWYKGIRITLDALKTLAEEGEDFRMVFVGGGTDRDEIVAYTESLGLGGKVIFIGPIHDRDRIRAWYCRADLFLFPSTFDTNGLVVREAAACALGSVLVAGSCAAEDVTDGVNGFLIEENAASMAACLRGLYAAPEKMHEIGTNAQRDIYISWETAVHRAYERYGIVIDNYRAGRYPKHETPGDGLFRGIGSLMDLIGTGEARRQAFQKHITDILEERRLTAGAEAEPQRQDALADWFHPFDAEVTNAVFQSMQSGWNEWKRQLAEGKKRGDELKKNIEDNLEEFYDIFL